MKSLLLACCVFLVTEVAFGNMKEKISEPIKEQIDQCAEEKQMAPVDLDKLFSTDLEGEEKLQYGCLHACILGRLNMMKGGSLNVGEFPAVLEKIFDNATPDKIGQQLEVMTQCADEVKEITDECELVYEWSRCVTIKDAE